MDTKLLAIILSQIAQLKEEFKKDGGDSTATLEVHIGSQTPSNGEKLWIDNSSLESPILKYQINNEWKEMNMTNKNKYMVDGTTLIIKEEL